MQLINALASVPTPLVQCHGSETTPIIAIIMRWYSSCCVGRKKTTRCFVRHIQTSTQPSYELHVEQTVRGYCTHYTSINTSLHPGGPCMPPYVQPTCTVSLTTGPLPQSNAWWISRCPIWAVMMQRKGSLMKSAGWGKKLGPRGLLYVFVPSSATVQHVLCSTGGTVSYKPTRKPWIISEFRFTGWNSLMSMKEAISSFSYNL